MDPPPVVELKIFEIDGPTRTDITFAYDANFFLFATLEMARPIANGRVPTPAAQVPVLTGMPVSGMAYLDRPSEAGYFIFPDLSVRHEGKYRLSFNLYEETKNVKDADKDPAGESKPKVKGTNDPESSFDWRMELKSDIFDVFSAKKFPGLAESTALSRTVAEQGCRVRIRRDVRMRRRGDGKGNDDFEDEGTYERQSRAETVDFQRERSRSSSNGSEGGGRVPLDQQNGILGFGGQQYQQHTGFPAPPPPPHVQQSQYPPPGYHQPQYGHPASHPPPQGHPYGHDSRQYGPQSAYPSYPADRERITEDWRRASMAGHSNEQFARHPAAPEHSFNHRPPLGYDPRSPGQGPVSLPPIRSTFENSPPALTPVRNIAPQLHSPNWERKDERPTSYPQHSAPLAAAPAPAPETARNGKRTYDTTFGSGASTQPLFNGMRPSSPHEDGMYDDDDDFSVMELKMNYKRADGSEYSRALPTLE